MYSPTALGSVGFVVNKVALRRFPPSISVSPVISHVTFINHAMIRCCIVTIDTTSLNNQLKEAKGSDIETVDARVVNLQGLAVYVYMYMNLLESLSWFPGQRVAGFACVWPKRNDEYHNLHP
jgi:hypothetical protein